MAINLHGRVTKLSLITLLDLTYMAIELPIIAAKLKVGRLNLKTKEVEVVEHVSFECNFSTTCCRTFDIGVTDFDIKRIETQGFALDQIIEKATPILRFAKNNDAERSYWIKRKPYTNTCTFLEDDKCSIHEFKPFACKIFPFQLQYDQDDDVSVIIHSTNMCKSVHAVPEENSETQDILEDLLDVVLNEDAYRQQYFKDHGNK